MNKEVYKLFVFLQPIFDALYDKSPKFREKLISSRKVKVFYQDLKKYNQPSEYNGIPINSIVFTDIFMYDNNDFCCRYLDTIACEDTGEETLDIRVWEVDYKGYPDKRSVLRARSLYDADLLIRHRNGEWKSCSLENVYSQISLIREEYMSPDLKFIHIHMFKEKLTCSLYREADSEDFEIVDDEGHLCNLVKILVSGMGLQIKEIFIFANSSDDSSIGKYYKEDGELVIIK